MKVGDMVRLKDVKGATGILLECGGFSEGWWSLLGSDGKMLVWPETQIEVISESR